MSIPSIRPRLAGARTKSAPDRLKLKRSCYARNMPIGLIWLLVIVLLPVVALYFLRSNAAAVYLSLCLGFVLYFFDSHKAYTAAGSLPAHIKASSLLVNLVLLIGPALLTMLIQIHSLHGSKKSLNLLPALFCGLFAALIIVPVLPQTMTHSINSTSYWHSLIKYQGSIVGIGAAVAILFFWFNLRKESGSKKHHAKD